MTVYFTFYSQNPDGFVSDAIQDYVWEYTREFRAYWGLDAEEPPEDLEGATWEVLKIWDRIAKRFLLSARQLREVDGSDIRGFLEWLRELGTDPTDVLFFRQVFELELADEFAAGALAMADRAMELVDLLMMIESDRGQSYLRRVADCYIRGLRTEAVVMCGAVLEAALEDYAPDDVVREALPYLKGRRYVLAGHRLEFVQEAGYLSPELAEVARLVLDDRNRALHVSPGLESDPKEQIERLAEVLAAFEPPEWLKSDAGEW